MHTQNKSILFIFTTVLVVGCSGPKPEDFISLKEPVLTTKESVRMLVVETQGVPDIGGPKAIKLLFKIYFKIDGVQKGKNFPAPRARWPVSADTPLDEWKGYFAMPVPDQTEKLPEFKNPDALIVSLETWEYGETAEIVHFGDYDKETPTIERLLHFIDENGYEITGDHEEEYIKGPGMLGPGNPDKYITIIRYPVRKKY